MGIAPIIHASLNRICSLDIALRLHPVAGVLAGYRQRYALFLGTRLHRRPMLALERLALAIGLD